jgi:hypothetical protein
MRSVLSLPSGICTAHLIGAGGAEAIEGEVDALANAHTRVHSWSQRYDREMADLFDLQDEIAQAIASALEVKLSGAPAPIQQYKPSMPAYEALLKARHYNGTFRPDLFPHTKECFEQAIALDPKFALAHCEYGFYFWNLALTGAMPANQAFCLDARSGTEGAGSGPFDLRSIGDARCGDGLSRIRLGRIAKAVPPCDGA